MLDTAIHRARKLDPALAGILVRVAARRVGRRERRERAEECVAPCGRKVRVLFGEQGKEGLADLPERVVVFEEGGMDDCAGGDFVGGAWWVWGGGGVGRGMERRENMPSELGRGASNMWTHNSR